MTPNDAEPPPPWRMVQVDCPCGFIFPAPSSLRGGLANCPSCGKAVPVKGGPEPLFWVIFGGIGVLVLGLAAGLGWAYGSMAAVATVVVGAALIGIILVLM
ncbi:MAG: hypothetical protein AAB434_09510 [Planctomycetota bacterium]